jgi:hypothetical protein
VIRRTIQWCALAAASCSPAGAGEIWGKVADARGGEPIERVEIRLEGTNRRATTDAHGIFSIADLAAGAYVLEVSTVGYRLARQRFTLADAERKEFDIALSPATLRQTQSVEVKAGPFEAVHPASPAELSLSGNELKNLASVLADDPLRAVQALPGVASNDDFDARFSLRGADYRRVGLYLDGILLHAPFHMVAGEPASGSLTSLNGEMLDAVSLQTGAFPARYEDRTAGALELESREGSRRQPSVRATASASNAGVSAEGPLGRAGRGSWLASARKSYLQYLIQRTSDEPSLAFGFTDAQMRLLYDVARGQTLAFSLTEGYSDLDRSEAQSRLGANSTMTSGYHLSTAGLSWRWAPSDRLLVTSRAAHIRERFENGNRENLTLASGMYREWIGSGDTAWNWSSQATLEAGWSARRLGEDGFSNRYQYNPFAVRRLEEYGGTALRAGGYVQQSWTPLSGRLQLSAGARWDRHSTDEIQAVSPHASMSVQLTRAARWQAGWGQYVQYPELAVLTSRVGRRTLLPERANHFLTAIEQRIDERTRLRLEFYEREDRDLIWRSWYDPRLVNGLIFNPPADDAYRNALRGYARGLEIFLQRRSANRLTGWISYTYGRARLRDEISRAEFFSDQDQRHGLNVYASYRLGAAMNLSLRWVYGSGFPIPGFLRKQGSTYYLAEARNQVWLDAYQRADVRVNRTFHLRRARLTLYGEVVNVFNRANYRFDSFNGYNSRTAQASVALDKMFPILPSAGIVMEWEGSRRGH